MTVETLGKEKLGNTETYGVFEETAPLKKVLMWGQPGPETVIAQILPEKISCFYEDFSVASAREEFCQAVQMIEEGGVEVIQVKDLFAQMVDAKKIEPGRSFEQLKDLLLKKHCCFRINILTETLKSLN